ncbi:NAD(P)/FAD-dependent oxidoreductase [Burkholderia glumae]|uniref:NAD(P)/FAD-dependent oxidoreductase n=1 Tax=Burkholderia glumae TaxID=337 RepID=UPI001373DA30|nr:FAD-binding oxidoreductase [Burkholderia glumae]MCR1770263.1 FAD-binding oxidoreductase [Burkholderia glumae]QHP94003.1 FAD-binding oxidoreductase [Burkholderia glumae]UVS98226.1 FAD-binding oxidoreductase [Burkholderia glumae]
MDFDVIVLGAGIVGVSVAVHLQDRGRRVALVDRQAPGFGTSFGNAGLIERSSVVPYAFPRSPLTLLRYAANQATAMYWHPPSLPGFAPWLLRFWHESAPARHAAAARDMRALIERSVIEHDALTARSAEAAALVRASGWIEAFRSPRAFERGAAQAAALARSHGLRYAALDGAALRAQQPSLRAGFAGGIHWLDPKAVSNPGALVGAYAALCRQLGGTLLSGDATTLAPLGDAQGSRRGWRVQTTDGEAVARDVVIALGPWSDTVFARFGYRIPLRDKRGYHMHYAPPAGEPGLSAPVVDIEQGYVIAPMQRGLRLTTGVELAARSLPPTGIQLARAERIARPTFGLGERLDPAPWLGMRPCTPDMRPVLGAAPRHPGMWFAFGHNHHGLTLGPITGRLLAQAICGEPPDIDLAPFDARRFER